MSQPMDTLLIRKMTEAKTADVLANLIVTKDMAKEVGLCQFTPLHVAMIIAARDKNREKAMFYVVKQLIAQGCPIDAKEEQGRTALLMAISFNLTDITLLLINAGADPFVKSEYDKHQNMPINFVRNAKVAEAILTHCPPEKISEALNARDTKGRPRVSDEARKFIKNAARKKRIRLVLDEGNIEIAALTPIERGVLAITSIAWAPVLGVLTILTAGQWQWPLQALQRGWHAIMGDELMPAPDPAPRPYPAQEEVSVKETAGGSAIPAPAVPTPAVPDLMHDEGLTDDLATGRASPNPPNTLGKK